MSVAKVTVGSSSSRGVLQSLCDGEPLRVCVCVCVCVCV